MIAAFAQAGDQTINFGWDVSADATSYAIFSGPTVDVQDQQLNTEPITEPTWTYVFTSEIEADIFFHVKATDGRNWSLPSNVVSAFIDTKAPASITTLTLTSD